MNCPKCGSTNVDGQEDDGVVSCAYIMCRTCHYIEVINFHDREGSEAESLADWQTDPDSWKSDG